MTEEPIGIPETWYLDRDEALAEDTDNELPVSQRGRFACTRQRNHFTLIFDNGDIMLMQPGVAAHFEDMCQGEESK